MTAPVLPTPGDPTQANTWGTMLVDYLTKGGTFYDVVNGYGATGDGVADDTAEIQTAIDAAETANGGIVFMPAGTYLISAPLNIPSYVHLVGVGNLTTKIIVATDIGVITTDASAVSWKIQDLCITVDDALGGHTTSTAITLGATNHEFEIENVIVDYSTTNHYKFSTGLYIPDGWTSTVKRFRVVGAGAYALNMAGGQAIHFDQCDFSGLSLTACALVAGNANKFTECKFQGQPVGLELTGDKNVFDAPWFENNFAVANVSCVKIHGSAQCNTFIGGSYTAATRLSGEYVRISDSASYNQFINPKFSEQTAGLIVLEDSAQENCFYGGNQPWVTVITAGAGNYYNIFSSKNAVTEEHIARWWYGEPNTEFHMGSATSGVEFRTSVSAVSSYDIPGLFTTASGGSAPFDAAGNLIIKPRNATDGSVEIWTGATPAVRAKFSEDGIYLAEELTNTVNNTMWMVKTIIKTLDVNDDASTDDYQFDDDAANTTEQPITLTNILPAYAELISWQIRCFETVTGSTAMQIDFGTSSGGAELGTGSPDTANDIIGSAAGAAPNLAATNAARSLYVSGTPGANWNTLDAGRWAIMITYVDYSGCYTQKSP